MWFGSMMIVVTRWHWSTLHITLHSIFQSNDFQIKLKIMAHDWTNDFKHKFAVLIWNSRFTIPSLRPAFQKKSSEVAPSFWACSNISIWYYVLASSQNTSFSISARFYNFLTSHCAEIINWLKFLLVVRSHPDVRSHPNWRNLTSAFYTHIGIIDNTSGTSVFFRSKITIFKNLASSWNIENIKMFYAALGSRLSFLQFDDVISLNYVQRNNTARLKKFNPCWYLN